MAHDQSRQDGDERPRAEDSHHDSADPIAIDTTDPAIDSAVEHQADWKAHPDTTVRVETTQVGEHSPLYISGVRAVVIEDAPSQGHRPDVGRGRDGGSQGRRRGDERATDQDRDRERDRDRSRERDDHGERGEEAGESDHDDRPDRSRSTLPMSMTKSLMLMAGVALVCGVLGAVGYAYFFGPKDDGSGGSQDKNESAKGKQADSAKKSGGGGSSKPSNAQASTSSSIPGFSSADDADTLRKQIMDLMQRVDRMGERVDRMTRPKDETPPVLRTMQIKMGELAREMGEVASLPAQFRHYGNRLETLQEDLKTLRARIDSLSSAPSGGRMTPGMTSPPGSDDVSGSGEANNPTMALGIGLLERSQYATAREVFLRLQLTRPDDARVWYLSALAEGLTGGDWDGAARKLADRGIECERAGHPPRARIDAALATSTAIKGEEWIASLRRRVLGASTAAK